MPVSKADQIHAPGIGLAARNARISATAIRQARGMGKPYTPHGWPETPRRAAVLGGQRERAPIAGGEDVVLALAAAAPDRADRVDHPPRRAADSRA